MKKQKSELISIGKTEIKLLILSALLLSQAVLAQTKVVVIPLAGDDISSVSHPVADTFTNSIGMQFNKLPAGSFSMGSPVGVNLPPLVIPAEPGRQADEVQHGVTLTKSFGMQITEVTNAQWNAVIVDSLLGSNPSITHVQDSYPVEAVDWYDAIFFANRLSLNEDRSACYTLSGVSGTPGTGPFSITTITQIANCTGYRLPTEAEWEYAARAGATKAYANPFGFDNSDTEIGDDLNGNLHAMGWYLYNNLAMGYTTGTKPVAKKQANAWGLYDMHGNVLEWVWDRYAAYSGNATDPVGPASGSDRVSRGGAWSEPARFSRSAYRRSSSPGIRNGSTGFRLVLTEIQ